MTPDQTAHVRRIQSDFTSAIRNVGVAPAATPKAMLVLAGSMWFRYASLAHPEWSRQQAIEAFQIRMAAKYANGVEEHGGNLWERDLPTLLEYLSEEIIDAVAYASTAAEKYEEHKWEVKTSA